MGGLPSGRRCATVRCRCRVVDVASSCWHPTSREHTCRVAYFNTPLLLSGGLSCGCGDVCGFTRDVVIYHDSELLLRVIGDLSCNIGNDRPEPCEFSWIVGKLGGCLHCEGHVHTPARGGGIRGDAVEIVDTHIGAELVHRAGLAMGAVHRLCGTVDPIPDRSSLVRSQPCGPQLPCCSGRWFRRVVPRL